MTRPLPAQPQLTHDDVPATVHYLDGTRVVVVHPDPFSENAIAARNRLRAKGYVVLDARDLPLSLLESLTRPKRPRRADR